MNEHGLRFGSNYPIGGEWVVPVDDHKQPNVAESVLSPKEQLDRELLARFELKLVTFEEILAYLNLQPGEVGVLGNTKFFG